MEQSKVPLVATSAKKHCIAVNMSHYVLKRLIDARSDGSSMKIKVAKDAKEIEIILHGKDKKDKFQFTKTPMEKLSKVLLLKGNQLEIIGDIKHQITSTKESNYKAKKDLAKKKLSYAYKEEQKAKDKKKIQVIDPIPDPIKPKNPKTNHVKRKGGKPAPVVSYLSNSSSFIQNDDTSGVPLKKRVLHLIAATELEPEQLNTDQIVKKVKDSKENVQKVLDEPTKKGTWKLKLNAWLTLEPHSWFSYGQKTVSSIVQKMNEVADKLGLPQPKNSTSFDGEPVKRRKVGPVSYLEVQSNNEHPVRNSTKSTRGGKGPKGRGAKTPNTLQKHEKIIEHDPKSVLSNRGGKPIRGRSSKTTETTSTPITSGTRRRGRPKSTSTTSRSSKLSTSKSTSALSSVTPLKRDSSEVNGHTLVNGVNNDIKQSQYRVNTLSEFRELIDEFKVKQDEYNELDEKLQSCFPLYKDLDHDLRNARQSREKDIINRIMETFGSGSEIFALVEQFNAIEEELRQISNEARRAVEEGVLDE
ncbi:11148_t:CDS:2 [Scutellospora calospora]|uniref:11148_t:CDS:1 n=1 Tax=Scutellospora calospora TaxID=85575 RepID=A0ACA9JVT1_9GLOM|nr:11148_t:CDS:2 [Scutellospora calospora]